MALPGIQQQKDFYDNYWRELKPVGSYKLARASWIAVALQQNMKRHKGEVTLVDLGCGDGRLAPFWQSVTGAKTFALELSPKAVATAQACFPTVTYTEGDATNTPYNNDAFDIIVCQEVIEHIEDQALLVSEFSRILKPGGTLILTTPNRFYFDRRNGGNYSTQPIEKIIDKAELMRLLQPQFSITTYETLVYAKGDSGIYKFITNRLLLAVLSRLGLLSIWKSHLLKKGYGLHMAVVCTKPL